MDLNDLESTTIYAVKAVYNKFWDLIPGKYTIGEDVGEKIEPFYDPELTFENRTHYKLTKVDQPKRAEPWVILTWNSDQGVMKSNLSSRRFKVGATVSIDSKTGYEDYLFTNANLQLNLCLYSNSITALFELQENYHLKIQEKMYATTTAHSILGEFPVNLETINPQMVKLPRAEGTICYLFIQCLISYPIIGYKENISRIETIDSNINNYEFTDLTKNLRLVQDVITNPSPSS